MRKIFQIGSDYLYGLNTKQADAANHLYGPALVLAGPGSGKTSVITARAVSLIEKRRVKPCRLLTVTFSRAAAEEMRKRYIKKVGEERITDSDVPEYCTLHSFCLKSIKYCKAYGEHERKILCGSAEKHKLISDIWNRINASENNILTFEYLELISNTISKIKCFSGTEKEADLRKDIQIRNFDEIFYEYEKYKQEKYLIDFDDMLSETALYLAEDKMFKALISEKYDFVQVDEGQDLSYLQIEIIKSVGSHGNVFMVADDDQGIYGFRGADVKSLKRYEEAFCGCKRYYLEQNYRSCGEIVSTASSFIRKNSDRYEKNIFTLNSAGEKIELIRTRDIVSQARFAAEIALANSAAGLTCGILYRKNMSALMPLLLLYELSRRNGIKASFCISGDFIHPCGYEIVKEYLEKILQHERHSRFICKSPSDIFRDMERCGKIDEYRNLCALKGQSAKETEYILSFTKVMGKTLKKYGQITEFLEQIRTNESESNIFFSTVHSSKGLEYDCVVIIDASEDEFPKRTAVDNEEIEEERRLFYVAMTRAKKKLYIVTPDKCGRIKCSPGIFFCETASVINA
ncbi:MAG: ATP-dependent helicase [Clostridia bacterium]|nr:ATP-dependent helicase [Clostridia bacterium]